MMKLTDLTRPLFSYRQGLEPNLALFASRRGGSTLVAEMIAINPGIWWIYEPFARIPGHIACTPAQRAALPEAPGSVYTESVLDEHADAIAEYVRNLLNGREREANGWLRRPKFPLRADRTLLKIVNANALIDWLVPTFNLVPIHLLRHPAAQALSVLHADWKHVHPHYLADDAFVSRFLTADQQKFARQVANDGSPFACAVLDWVLEHLAPLKTGEETVRLYYEQLVIEPERVVGELADDLRLNAREQMVRQVRGRPSGSAKFSASDVQQALQRNDSQALVSRWKQHVDDTDAAAAQRILDAFNITHYTMDDPMPHATPSTHRPA